MRASRSRLRHSGKRTYRKTVVAALAAAPGLSTLVITKDGLRESNSSHAQGGIASVLDPEDRFEDHVADTLVAGGSLCDRAVVERVVREAPLRIEELIGWGTNFDQVGGRLALGREGGHGCDRIAHETCRCGMLPLAGLSRERQKRRRISYCGVYSGPCRRSSE